ncbi:hypothetical protein [Bacteroides sp. 519]|uniref:hypothetical protein n=1 Tax=Bacteroides sp. 519 TaxID=2302937 RepID=UPI0013D832BE|nr:hypothetical protein [Bacteroides sp. 519]NDV59043.1 hypothetical protein [Bacteroides sp. 519]
MKRKIISLTLLLLFGIGIVFAQDIQFPRPLTPEAATMMKYIDQPVNYCHGLANVTIPLYELKEGDITLPITATFHSSGNKVNELSSRIGLNWALNIEPSISRRINGLPDEYGYLVTTGRQNYNYPRNHWDMEMLASGQANKDEDPDLFYYQLSGKSGKFYFKRSGTLEKPGANVDILTIPYEPVRIEPDRTNGHLHAFDVTDDGGTYYRFGKSLGTQAIALGTSAGQHVQWKATEMLSPSKKDTLYFKYATTNTNITTQSNTDYIAISNCLYV